jgi:hypothetical protein
VGNVVMNLVASAACTTHSRMLMFQYIVHV